MAGPAGPLARGREQENYKYPQKKSKWGDEIGKKKPTGVVMVMVM